MTDSQIAAKLRENWLGVIQQVQSAASDANRSADGIEVIGVTKYVDATMTRALVVAGCRTLGENRPQVLCEKAKLLADLDIQWHQIGHVQRNKVKKLLDHSVVIQTIDSARILSSIGQEAQRRNLTISVMLEVNISGDESKTGLNPNELDSILDQVPRESVDVIGLMGMAGLGSDSDSARKQFGEIRTLRDKLATSSGFALDHLSMGMSGDFCEAIAEGATMVRIGSRLFEGLR